MSSFSKMSRHFGSWEVCCSLVTVLAVFTAYFSLVRHLPFWDIMELLPSRIFLAVITMNRLMDTFTAFREMRKDAVISAGVIVLISGFLINYGYRFDGSAGIGEGETFSRYRLVEKGPLAAVPSVPLTVLKIEASTGKDGNSSHQVIVSTGGSEKKTISAGQSIALGLSEKIHFLSVQPAPRFRLSNARGEELDTAFVKLKLKPQGEDDYFVVTHVPHRFYLRETGNPDKPYRLRITRGKISIVNREIALSEEIRFEGVDVSFPEDAAWAEMKISRYPGTMLVYAGLAICMAGALNFLRLSGRQTALP